MNCKLCNSQTNNLFSKTILSKYQANYFQCTKCRFIFTINNSWLQEAYSNAITSLDIGLVNRNIRMLNAIPRILDGFVTNGKNDQIRLITIVTIMKCVCWCNVPGSVDLDGAV